MGLRKETRTVWICDVCGGEFISKKKAEAHDKDGSVLGSEFSIGDNLEPKKNYQVRYGQQTIVARKLVRTTSKFGYRHSYLFTLEAPDGKRRSVWSSQLKTYWVKKKQAA